MKISRILAICALLVSFSIPAHARMDVVELFVDSLLRSDTGELEKILAPNFWFIGANGHIRDKEHFIEEIANHSFKVDHLNLSNIRETKVGETRLVTANGNFQGASQLPMPGGLMRFSMVVAENQGEDEIALFQATPVIATPGCTDGNCQIR